MAALARGQTTNCANPVLDLFTTVNGVLTDVAELEFIVFEEVTTPGTPVQVFPVAGRATVNVTALCPVGNKLSTGRFAADWTVPLTEPIGTHSICWFFKLTPASPEQTSTEEFEVLPEVTGSTSVGYCSVQDLRDEGVPASFSDARLQDIIARASKLVDLYTGQWFEPRSLTITLNGRNSPTMFLGMPIISITSLKVDGLELLGNEFAIYNRHISEQLLNPDDRENPRVELEQPREGTILYRHTSGRRVFPRGERNVEITGTFGYTNYDGGSPNGRTPDLICHVTKLIALRELPAMYTDADDRADAALGGRVTKLKTRDQEITYAAPTAANMGRQGVGMFTGDPAIDNILMQYRRPIHIGSTGGSGV